MNVFRVEPPQFPSVPVRDSDQPERYSLLHQHSLLPETIGVSYSKKHSTEILFESVRKSKFPKKPSRYIAIFAFKDLEAAEWFRDCGRMEKNGTIVEYEVTRRDDIFEADMDLFNSVANLSDHWMLFQNKNPFLGMTLKEARQHLVHMYWGGEKLVDILAKNDGEYIVKPSELLIIGRVELVRVIG